MLYSTLLQFILQLQFLYSYIDSIVIGGMQLACGGSVFLLCIIFPVYSGYQYESLYVWYYYCPYISIIPCWSYLWVARYE